MNERIFRIEDINDERVALYTEYNEQFHSFALIALFLLVIDFFIFNRKNKALTRLDIFGEK